MLPTNPNFLAEIMLDSTKIEYLFNGVFMNSEKF